MKTPPLKRHKTHNRACVYINGKTKYLGRWDDNGPSPEALAAHARFCAQLRRPANKSNKPKHVMLADLAEAFLEDRRFRYVDEHTGQLTSSFFKSQAAIKRLLAMFADFRAKAFKPWHLQAIVNDMERKQMGVRTISEFIMRIKMMYQWGETNRMTKTKWRLALESVKTPKASPNGAQKSKPHMRIDRSVVEQTLPHLPLPIRQMVMLQLETGCRGEHVTNMRLCDIDMSDQDVWMWTPMRDKTGNTSAIPMTQQAMQIVVEASKRPDGSFAGTNEFLFRPCDSPKATRIKSDRYNSNTYRRAIERACDRLGLEKWTPHRLRKQRGHEIGNEFGTDGVRAMLVHKSMKMADFYSEDRSEAGKALARRLNEAG